LRKLKPNGATYKVANRDGMYVIVSKSGAEDPHHIPESWQSGRQQL